MFLKRVSLNSFREDYIKKQSDKFCGRKTFEERLKSLESEASVSLKVKISIQVMKLFFQAQDQKTFFVRTRDQFHKNSRLILLKN